MADPQSAPDLWRGIDPKGSSADPCNTKAPFSRSLAGEFCGLRKLSRTEWTDLEKFLEQLGVGLSIASTMWHIYILVNLADFWMLVLQWQNP